MSKKVKVANIYEITWPHVCARCGNTQHLKNVISLENKLTTKIAKTDPQLEYFVCEKHAKWLALANLSVDGCGTMTLVRLVSSFATILFSIFLITLPLQLIHTRFSDISVPYILVIFVAYMLFSHFLRKQIPINKTKFSTKEYVLEFDNHQFAEMFVKENQQHTIIERLN
ncbi:hypothetical protein [uncultured Tolumonas sp.]|uniref:hypothetical protein n=1 Tax=uncultured Tolumonas sp. TaxID=263765 RepID=UPI00292FE97C|nr:hypothetical protein [uncultured Tolumonas sp.]